MTNESQGDQDEAVTATADTPEPPRCAECGGVITQEDLICPHCGISLVGG